MRRVAAGVSLMMLLAACAVGDADAAPANLDTLRDTTTTIRATTTTETPETIPDEDVTEFAVFLVAVDEGLSGTPYEGSVYEAPEAFVATALLFCDLFDAGLSTDEVLTAYASALSAQSDDGEVLPEDMLLGGVLLGAGVRVLCPQFLEDLNL